MKALTLRMRALAWRRSSLSLEWEVGEWELSAAVGGTEEDSDEEAEFGLEYLWCRPVRGFEETPGSLCVLCGPQMLRPAVFRAVSCPLGFKLSVLTCQDGFLWRHTVSAFMRGARVAGHS